MRLYSPILAVILLMLSAPVVLAQEAEPEQNSAQPPDEESTPNPVLIQGTGPLRGNYIDPLEPLRQRHRSSKAAILMSLPFPGWGQLYADAPLWGVVAFSAQMYYLGNILMEFRRHERQRVARDLEEPGSALRQRRDLLVNEHSERVRDYVWWAAGGLLLVSLDAYVSIQLVDFDSPDPPTPDLDRDWDQATSDGGEIGLALQFSF